MSLALKTMPDSEKPPATEVRCAVRFPLSLPIRVVTKNGEYDAVTENISASGVLFKLDKALNVDSVVEFFLKMPAQVLGTPADVVLRCAGRVVRSYGGAEDYHAAAVIDDYVFTE